MRTRNPVAFNNLGLKVLSAFGVNPRSEDPEVRSLAKNALQRFLCPGGDARGMAEFANPPTAFWNSLPTGFTLVLPEQEYFLAY